MTSSSAASKSAPTILIIDDEGPFREQVSSALEAEGFEVDVAADKTLGGHMLAARRPDLV